MGTSELITGSNTVMDKHPIQGGVEILLVASCYSNQDKLPPDGLIGLIVNLLLTPSPGSRETVGQLSGTSC